MRKLAACESASPQAVQQPAVLLWQSRKLDALTSQHHRQTGVSGNSDAGKAWEEIRTSRPQVLVLGGGHPLSPLSRVPSLADRQRGQAGHLMSDFELQQNLTVAGSCPVRLKLCPQGQGQKTVSHLVAMKAGSLIPGRHPFHPWRHVWTRQTAQSRAGACSSRSVRHLARGSLLSGARRSVVRSDAMVRIGVHV